MSHTVRIAAELLSALDRRAIVEPITNTNPGFDAEAAYRVSAEIVRLRGERGERPIGRKIGFTNRLIWDQYGVSGPMWAHVYDSTVTFLDVPAGRLPIGHLVQPLIEPEIILHFAEAPRAADTEAEILARIDWIAHGFEIVQSLFADWKFTLQDTIAAFGLHGALVVGPKQPVSGVDGDCAAKLRTFTIALAKDGNRLARGGGANVLDSPLCAAMHLVRMLANQPQFAPIAAGEIVTTGTLTSALPIRGGETWATEVAGLPVPGLSIKFE